MRSLIGQLFLYSIYSLFPCHSLLIKTVAQIPSHNHRANLPTKHRTIKNTAHSAYKLAHLIHSKVPTIKSVSVDWKKLHNFLITYLIIKSRNIFALSVQTCDGNTGQQMIHTLNRGQRSSLMAILPPFQLLDSLAYFVVCANKCQVIRFYYLVFTTIDKQWFIATGNR
jgi:hypothetical protein